MRELFPCAMFANGPAWTSAGWPSIVCTRLGLIASLSRTVIAPAMSRSSAVTGAPSTLVATVIAPRRCRRSSRSRAIARSAMTSEAAVMSNPLSCGNGASSPTPTVIRRRTRSSMSRHRRQAIVAGSIPRSFPCRRWASIAEASRLLAAAIACRSPVKCRLMSSRGTTWARPAPVPPPLAPSVGPTEGSRRQTSELSPIWPKPSVRATAVVVLPSPAFVGVTAVTAISFPLPCVASRSRTDRSIFALSRPKSSTSAGSRSRLAASSEIGRRSDSASGPASASVAMAQLMRTAAGSAISVDAERCADNPKPLSGRPPMRAGRPGPSI